MASETDIIPVEMSGAKWNELLDLLYLIADTGSERRQQQAEDMIDEIEEQCGIV